MAEFARRFQGQVHDHVLAAMRSLFKLGEKEDDDIDTPLLLHGGAPAMDQDA
jgi:hypothetical protein